MTDKYAGLSLYRMAFFLFITLLTGTMLPASANEDWADYKQRFIAPDGRVMDTGNNNISHSEGQGYGMLLAVFHDDEPSFCRMWEWARKKLGRYDLPLFAWKYDPASTPHVKDDNNATDGDILIAWALLQAGRKWQNSNYLNISRRIRHAVSDNLIKYYADHWVLVPGLKGFSGEGYVDLNLSYWVIPALQDFAATDNHAAWSRVIDSGLALLSLSKFGDAQLPADWIRLQADGSVKPAPDWPGRFGPDAVRIGLYLAWGGYGNNKSLEPVKLFWNAARDVPPAWIDLESSQVAPYQAPGGVVAIRELLSSRRVATELNSNDDYYSASLIMLSKVAQNN